MPDLSLSTVPPAAVSPTTGSAKLARVETAIVALVIIALAVLRWFSVTSHRWNTDEAQHLHVVWGWTVGLVQYRDLFDNHTPLFHILCAPLLSWFGERADIILLMRRVMIPLFAISVWCVYRLGATLYDRRTGWYSALLAALLPAFFYRMGEYRTDVLWTTVWLMTLVVTLVGEMSPARIFRAALLLGMAFMVSMKTTLLVFCVAVAGIITWWLAGRPISKAWPRYVAAFVGGLVIVPGLIVLYFASQHALEPLYHCVIKHNTLPGRNLGYTIGKQLLSQSTLWLIPVWFLTRAMLPSVRREPARGYRRLFLFLIAGLFYSLLRGFWPVVTTQDYLPWMPLLPIFVVAGISWLVDFVEERFRQRIPWLLLPTLLLAGEIAMIVTEEPPFLRVEDRRISHLSQILHLINPGEYVLDLKGETIYRPRPCYLVMESLTLEQLQRGTMKNNIAERLIATRTALVRKSDRMPAETREFIDRNYVRINRMWVPGKKLPTVAGTPLKFEIVIPASYRLLTAKGTATGTLDGQPFDGDRWLEAGQHELTVTPPTGETALVWARAVARGYSPYYKIDPQEE
jgi:hypothetical protein